MRKLLFAVVILGVSVLGSMPREASALYPTCSTFYCNGSPTRNCTCPGTTFSSKCSNWASGGCILP